MRFNQHYELKGQHAFLGASKYHWIRYDLEKMKKIWVNQFKSKRGSELHEIARILIEARLKLDGAGLTLTDYVNDAIRYRMTPEVLLKFSENCFGTADAIGYYPDHQELRIHDLKTGTHPSSFDQLHIYAALFCFEYKINPYDITIILRIYQNDAIEEMHGIPSEVLRIISVMEEFDPEIEDMKAVM